MQLSEITTIGQLFSEEARVRILCLLYVYDEACLADLNKVFTEYETQKVHRHIKYIEAAGWVSSLRYGTWVFYSLPLTIPEYLGRLIETAMRTKQVQDDIAAYRNLLDGGELAASAKARDVVEAK